jgi:hypothetical protein
MQPIELACRDKLGRKHGLLSAEHIQTRQETWFTFCRAHSINISPGTVIQVQQLEKLSKEHFAVSSDLCSSIIAGHCKCIEQTPPLISLISSSAR